ncbi:MAG: glycosyltransferase family 39 protein [bacterium]
MSKNKEYLLLFVIILLGLVLRLYRLDNQSLWIDEVMRLNIATQNSISDILSVNYKWDSQPPVYHLLNHWWLKISQRVFWIRTLPLIFGVMTIPLIYALGAYYFNKKVGLLAAFILSLSPFHVWHSQDANMYTLLIFLTVLSIYSMLKILDEKRLIWYIVYICATLLGLYTHYYFSSVVIATNLFVFLFFKKYSYRIRFWIITQIGIGLLTLPDIWFFLKLTTPFYDMGVQGRGFTFWSFPYTFFTFINGYSIGPAPNELHSSLSINFVMGKYAYIILPIFLVISFLVLAGFLRLKSFDKVAFWFIILITLIPVLFIMAGVMIVFPKYNVRYAFGGFPTLCLLLSIGVHYFKNKVYQSLILTIFIAMSLFSLSNYYYNTKYHKEESRAAAQYIHSHIKNNDAILVSLIKEPFKYYFGEERNVYGVYGNDLDSSDGYDKLDQILGKHNRLWLVYARAWITDPKGDLLKHLNRTYKMKQVKSFPGVKVFLFSS